MLNQPTRAQLVSALAKPGAEIMGSMTPEKMHLLHMTLGLADEIFELLIAEGPANTLEELGDAWFYIEGIYQGFGRTVPVYENCKDSVSVDTRKYATVASDIVGTLKRYTIQNKPLDEAALFADLDKLGELLTAEAELAGFTDADIHADNLRKLGKRYAGLQYSDAAAAARVDKQ